MPPEVKAEFVAAIRWLDTVRHVSAISGDCATPPLSLVSLFYLVRV